MTLAETVCVDARLYHTPAFPTLLHVLDAKIISLYLPSLHCVMSLKPISHPFTCPPYFNQNRWTRPCLYLGYRESQHLRPRLNIS